MLAEKAWQLIQNKKMHGFSKKNLIAKLINKIDTSNFNLYQFVEEEVKE